MKTRRAKRQKHLNLDQQKETEEILKLRSTAMAEINGSLQLDPISFLLSRNSDPQNSPVSLKLVTDGYFMERGPRYNEYAQLRESKLRRKNPQEQENEGREPKRSPLKKQVRFQANLTSSRKGSSVSSVLAQSVSDFSATLRKENRKPLTAMLDLTPPSKNWLKMNANFSNSRGSRSASAGERKGMMARKSYANIEELKGLSMGVAKDICGENRGRTRRTGVEKTILCNRQLSMFG